jgi:hypothetical protein
MKSLNVSSKPFFELVIQAFTTESRQSYKIFAILLLVSLTSLSIVLVNMGAPPINAIPWDVMLLLDGGWRIVSGQIPHTDYYNPIGPLTYLLVAFGMKIAQPAAAAITYGNVLSLIVLAPWAWLIACNRLPSVMTFIFVVFIIILLIAPRALGFSEQLTTYAMLYNRQAFSLYAMLLVELFIPKRLSFQLGQPKYFNLLSGLSSGVLLALLLFCKITYFGFGIIAVLIYVLLFQRSRTWLGMFLSGFLLSCVCMQFFFGISLLDYFNDIAFAAHSQSTSGKWLRLKEGFLNNFSYIYLVFSFLFILSIDFLSLSKTNNFSFLQESKIWIISIFLVFSSLLICVGNTQNGQEIPLFFVMGLIMFEYLHRELELSKTSKVGAAKITYLISIFILIPFLGGTIFVKDIASVAYSVGWHKSRLPSIEISQRFQSKTLHDFVVPESSEAVTVYWKVKDVPYRINEGLALLRKYISNESRIFLMGYSNPFPFALGLPSPRGTSLWWDINYSFNKDSYPSPEKIFKDTTMVMIPNVSSKDPGCCMDTLDLMKKLYGDFLGKNFVEKDRSQFWTLLVRL